MIELFQSVDWSDPATYSAILGALVVFMTTIVAPIVRLTPTKRDDRILAKVLGFAERFSLVAFNKPTKELR